MRKLLAVVATAFVAATAAILSPPAMAAPAAGALAGASGGVADARVGTVPVEQVHYRRRHRGLSFHFGFGAPRYYGYGYRPYRYYDAYPYYYAPRYYYQKRKYKRRHLYW